MRRNGKKARDYASSSIGFQNGMIRAATYRWTSERSTGHLIATPQMPHFSNFVTLAAKRKPVS